jgi:hypothetical protein
MNSVLNRIYTLTILDGNVAPSASLHNGDDVIVAARNLEVARATMDNANRHHIRLQPAKCAYGAIAEFLRVDHLRGSKGQYLTRACATLVHSRIETSASSDIRDLIQAMEGRFSDSLSRGMPLRTITLLRRQYYNRQAQDIGVSPQIFYKIKESHRSSGGISSALDADVDTDITSRQHNATVLDLPRTLPGIPTYAKVIEAALQLDHSVGTYAKRLEKATLEAVMPKERLSQMRPAEDVSWNRAMRSIFKAHRGTLRVAEYGKAALVGFGFEVIGRDISGTPLAAVLQSCRRPLQALPLLL